MRSLLTALLLILCAPAPLPAGDWGKQVRLAAQAHRKGDLKKAEELLLKALLTLEASGQPADQRHAFTLDYLGTLNMQMGDAAKAEPLLSRALKGFEESSGPDSAEASESRLRLAESFEARGMWAKAEPLYRRVAASPSRSQEQRSSDLNSLAVAVDAQGRYEEALELYGQALALRKPGTPEAAEILTNQARVYYMKEDYAKAEPLFLEALAIDERVLGKKHPQVAEDCERLAPLYRKMGREEEAVKLEKRAAAIRKGKGGT